MTKAQKLLQLQEKYLREKLELKRLVETEKDKKEKED